MKDSVCSVEGCDKPVFGRGWCSMHYTRWKNHGDLFHTRVKPPERVCSVPGCGEKHDAKGFCNVHYARWKNHGDPLVLLQPKGRDKPPARPCQVEDCNELAKTRGYCAVHYRRWMKWGDPNIVKKPYWDKKPPSPCGVEGCPRLARAMGLCYLHWERQHNNGDVGSPLPTRAANGQRQAPKHGYIFLPGDGGPVHRRIMEEIVDRPLHSGEFVHHKNGVRSDNRPENLELWAKPHPAGQRVEDLVTWVVEQYPDLVRVLLDRDP